MRINRLILSIIVGCFSLGSFAQEIGGEQGNPFAITREQVCLTSKATLLGGSFAFGLGRVADIPGSRIQQRIRDIQNDAKIIKDLTIRINDSKRAMMYEYDSADRSDTELKRLQEDHVRYSLERDRLIRRMLHTSRSDVTYTFGGPQPDVARQVQSLEARFPKRLDRFGRVATRGGLVAVLLGLGMNALDQEVANVVNAMIGDGNFSEQPDWFQEDLLTAITFLNDCI